MPPRQIAESPKNKTIARDIVKHMFHPIDRNDASIAKKACTLFDDLGGARYKTLIFNTMRELNGPLRTVKWTLMMKGFGDSTDGKAMIRRMNSFKNQTIKETAMPIVYTKLEKHMTPEQLKRCVIPSVPMSEKRINRVAPPADADDNNDPVDDPEAMIVLERFYDDENNVDDPVDDDNQDDEEDEPKRPERRRYHGRGGRKRIHEEMEDFIEDDEDDVDKDDDDDVEDPYEDKDENEEVEDEYEEVEDEYEEEYEDDENDEDEVESSSSSSSSSLSSSSEEEIPVLPQIKKRRRGSYFDRTK